MHHDRPNSATRREWATRSFSLALDLLESFSHTIDYPPLPEYEAQLRQIAADVHGALLAEVEKRVTERRELEEKRASGEGPRGWFLKEIEGTMVVNPYLLEMGQMQLFPPEKSLTAIHFRPHSGGIVCRCTEPPKDPSLPCPSCLGTGWLGAYQRLSRNLSMVETHRFVNPGNYKMVTGYAHPHRFPLEEDVLLVDDQFYVVRRHMLVALHCAKTDRHYKMWYLEASEPIEDELAGRAEALLRSKVE